MYVVVAAAQRLHDAEEPVEIVDEAALAGPRRLGAEAALGVEHRQMGDADARALGGGDHPFRQLGAVRIGAAVEIVVQIVERSEEHTSEIQSLMRISYAVFCLK